METLETMMKSIIYETHPLETGRDVFQEIASRLYDTPYEEVTVEQRGQAKRWVLHQIYGR